MKCFPFNTAKQQILTFSPNKHKTYALGKSSYKHLIFCVHLQYTYVVNNVNLTQNLFNSYLTWENDTYFQPVSINELNINSASKKCYKFLHI